MSLLPEAVAAQQTDTTPDTSYTSPETTALRGRLTSAPSVLEQESILLEVVREHAAAVLGYAGPAEVQPDVTFLEQGFNSLSAVEVRNRLARVTGLSLPGALVFQHPTPAEAAAHLRERLTEDTAGAVRVARRFALAAPDGERGEPVAAESLTPLYERAHRAGRGADAMRMITGLAAFRPSFTDPAELTAAAPLVPISRGPDGAAGPMLICLPSFGASADAQEFARLAHALHGARRIVAATVPGYVPGEPLAAGPCALLDLYTRTVLAAVEAETGTGPYVLVGYSSGGLTAHALAVRLTARGRPPAGLVLIDTFQPDRAGVPDELLAGLPAAVLANNGDTTDAYGIGGDDWLTAFAHYYAFDWRDHLPHAGELPTLLIRHDGAPDHTRAPWPLSGDVTPRTVPGDHFSMIGSHADTTARAVEAWLAEHLSPQGGQDR
ncbi:thioesterase domain-containing protein [Actinoplanes sp. G11-F43]|uniref:thioesterase domain-containing protein n=1 Tax=Actinoplanes sp. G11-F43 TaxID=3424130 RepID=UPI003D32999C